jgi:preprotein translocase subunit SecA
MPVRDEVGEIIGATKVAVDDPVTYIQNTTQSFVRDHLLQLTSLKGERAVVFPDHLADFVDHHITNWVDASITARTHKENASYVVRNNHFKYPELAPDYNIVPVDLETGTMLYRLTWQNGVSQFLQMNHGLKVTSEGLTSIFQSYVSYFLKYKGSIYGLTGTLGTSKHQEFLHHIYDVDFAFIPNFQVGVKFP